MRNQEPSATQELLDLIPTLRLLARGFLRHSDGADDLVQETLLRALAHIGSYQPGTNMRAWLFTIMRNAYLSRARRSTREIAAGGDCAAAEPVCQPVHDLRIGCAELLEAVRRLPMPYREALILVFLMEESYDEAARICGCPVGTIKSRISRARAMLLAELGEAPLAGLVTAES